jgi:hypothetical protein
VSERERNAGPIGVVLGVVLLGAVAAFAIALPGATGEDGDGEQAERIELPDTLPHGLVAEDQRSGDPESEKYADRVASIQTSADEGLERLFDAPATVRGYASEDGSVQATVTVLDRAPGLFDPHGPPIEPELLDLERSVYELRRVGDAICDLYWQQVVPAGQPVDESADPSAVMCQLGDGDRTLEIFSSGLSAEAAIEVLESLVSGA